MILSQDAAYNRIVRFARIGKLYKVIRMLRLIRLFKIIKERNSLGKYMTEVLRIGLGFERFIFMLIIYLILQHIIACIWIFTAKFDESSKKNWIYKMNLEDAPVSELYVSAFYFTVTTIVTVGYGDITAQNVAEKCLCTLLMLIGVIAFSFGTGALSSIISNYDSSQAKLQEKMQTLDNIKSEYKIGSDLYKKLVRSVRYDHSKSQKDFVSFIDELPYKLKIELAMEIHKSLYQTVGFFKFKEKSFIAWIGTILRPLNV